MFVASAVVHRSNVHVAPSVAKIGTKISSFWKIVSPTALTNKTPLNVFQILFSIFWSYESTSLTGMLFAVVTKILASIFDWESIFKYVPVTSFVHFHTFYGVFTYCLAVPDHHCHQVALSRVCDHQPAWPVPSIPTLLYESLDKFY